MPSCHLLRRPSNRAVEPTKCLCHLCDTLDRPPSCSPKTADRVSKLSELLPRGVSVPARSWQPKLRGLSGYPIPRHPWARAAHTVLGLVFVATMALIFIFNRSWLVGPRSTTTARNEKPTEKQNVGAETVRVMIKPTRGLWHFCYSE